MNTSQPRQLYLAKLSIIKYGERKLFHEKSKFEQYLSTNPALQKIPEGKRQPKRLTTPEKIQRMKNTRSEKQKVWETTQQQQRQHNRNHKHGSFITLNINGLNSSMKRQRLTD